MYANAFANADSFSRPRIVSGQAKNIASQYATIMYPKSLFCGACKEDTAKRYDAFLGYLIFFANRLFAAPVMGGGSALSEMAAFLRAGGVGFVATVTSLNYYKCLSGYFYTFVAFFLAP